MKLIKIDPHHYNNPQDVELGAQNQLDSCEKELKEKVERIFEKGNTFCVEINHYEGLDKRATTRKRECRRCWQSLKKEILGEAAGQRS